MSDKATKNDYLDMLDSIKTTKAMQKVIDEVIEAFDSDVMKLRPTELRTMRWNELDIEEKL